jgi:hypothetical protein
MMTDHCTKKKKDVCTLEKLKKSAVLQQLDKQKILDSDNQELVEMMTDHCAKEKKDVCTLEKLKKSAVLQQLGEQKILDSDNQELVPKFYAKYHEVISKLGGTSA